LIDPTSLHPFNLDSWYRRRSEARSDVAHDHDIHDIRSREHLIARDVSTLNGSFKSFVVVFGTWHGVLGTVFLRLVDDDIGL
jgi:hypothetical protein